MGRAAERCRAGQDAAVLFAVLLITLIAAGPSAASSDSLNRWRNLFPTTNADNRDSHNMAWDADSDRIVLFGGHQGGCQTAGCFNKTYTYDFATNNWTTLTLYPNMEKRAEFGMTYDSKHDRIVTFGGPANAPCCGPSSTNSTWTFDYDNLTWSNRTPVTSPPPAGVSRIAYDSESDRSILWYPGQTDVWAYDYQNNTWLQRSPPTPRPPDGASMSLSYDSLHDRVIMTMKPWGAPGTRETWAYDFNANAWLRRAMTGPVPADNTAGGALPWTSYDSNDDLTILYMDDRVTWAYNWTANEWADLSVQGPPGHHFSFVYVAEYDQFLFYGGVVGNNRNTWVYEFAGPAVEESLNLPIVVIAAVAGVLAWYVVRSRRCSRRAVSHA